MKDLDHYAFSHLIDGESALLRGTCADGGRVLLVTSGSASSGIEIRLRLQREYALRSSLVGAWCATPLSLVRFRGQPALVLTDPGGESLVPLLGHPMLTEEFLPAAVAIVRAVGAMHDRGLVHGDIKPAQFLLADDGTRACLTGFGIARLVGDRDSVEHDARRIMGTLAYMAPEQTGRVGGGVDARADLYALGVMFYEMLTGELPFLADGPNEWVHSHIARQPLPPFVRHPSVPVELSAITMRLMAKSADERFQDAHALEAQLQAHAALWRTRGTLSGHWTGAAHEGAADAPDASDVLDARDGHAPEDVSHEPAPAFCDDAAAAAAAAQLEAGTRALSGGAHAAAQAFFTAGIAALPADAWRRCRTAVFSLFLGLAECELRLRRFDDAQARLTDLALRASALNEHARVTRLRVSLLTTLDRSDEAVHVGLSFMARIGLGIGPDPDGQVRVEYQRLMALLSARTIESLAHLPPMRDPTWRAVMGVLAELISPASFMHRPLRDLLPVWMALLSVEHGNDDASSNAYVHLGMLLGPRLGDYAAGYRFGQVGLALVEQEGMDGMRAKVHLCFGALLLPWTQPVRGGTAYIRMAFDEGRRSGDLNFAAYSCNQMATNLLACGEPLAEVQREIDAGLAFAGNLGLRRVIDILTVQGQYVAMLRGRRPITSCLIADAAAERAFEHRFDATPVLAVAAFCYWVRKLQASFHAFDYERALVASCRAESLLWTAPYFFEASDFHFFSGLAHAWSTPVDADLPSSVVVRLEVHYRQFSAWCVAGPANFLGRKTLLEAERARLAHAAVEALRLYDLAARLASEQGFIHDEALSLELAARCCAGEGLEAMAAMYLAKASAAYREWGAQGKADQLEEACAVFRPPPHERGVSGHGGSANGLAGFSTSTHAGDRLRRLAAQASYSGSSDRLDVDTVVHASQALASEIHIDRLLEVLMANTLQHAAAERGLLFLWRAGALSLVAHTRIDQDRVSVSMAPTVEQGAGQQHGDWDDGAHYPSSLIVAALKSREDVIVYDARLHPVFGLDDDVRARAIRSAACLVLVKQGELIGLLYVENTLASGVFTPRRAALLSMLAAQAAISLENARLYAELVHENRERQRVQAELAHVSRVTTLGELAASIAHEVNQPLAGIVTYGDACLRWLDRETPDLPEARHAVTSMISEGIRASEVIKRIRALARKDGARRAPLDLGDVVAESVALIGHQALMHHVTDHVELAAGLPPVMGDRIQLQQVVINLMVNAIQAMSSHAEWQRLLTICTDLAPNGHVRLTVGDTGPGIAASAMPSLFEAFYTTRTEGLGMGLSICRSIIEGHGGNIWAEPAGFAQGSREGSQEGNQQGGREARPVGQPTRGPGAVFRFALPPASGG